MTDPSSFEPAPATRDLEFNFLGSLVLCTPMTDAAREWIDEHVSDESTWWGLSLVVEPRYVDYIVAGASSDGLTCGAN